MTLERLYHFTGRHVEYIDNSIDGTTGNVLAIGTLWIGTRILVPTHVYVTRYYDEINLT